MVDLKKMNQEKSVGHSRDSAGSLDYQLHSDK